MERRDFLSQLGIGTAAFLIPACLGGLAACKKASSNTSQATPVDFTLDISKSVLQNKGGYLLNNGVIIANPNSGIFIAVSSACTHQGTTINYSSNTNSFVCPNHGAVFDSSGNVMQGPATINLTKYNTTLTGNNLRVYS